MAPRGEGEPQAAISPPLPHHSNTLPQPGYLRLGRCKKELLFTKMLAILRLTSYLHALPILTFIVSLFTLTKQIG